MRQTKFLLLLGPSGVGKTTIIKRLCKRDNRFIYISPYVTRPLREGETDKISISDSEMDDMEARQEFLVVNPIYGIRYGTPHRPIEKALRDEQFPLLDWPVNRIGVVEASFANRLFVVYISPPSLGALRARLSKDGRDHNGKRYQAGESELNRYWRGEYDLFCNLKIVSCEDAADEIAEQIYGAYLTDIEQTRS